MLNIHGQVVSGNSYIAFRLRDEARNPHNLRNGLIIMSPQNCNHGTVVSDEEDGTACETAACLNSWSLDYRFFLRRTVRGRAIIERFHLTDEQVEALASNEHRGIHPSNDPFDSQYDREAVRNGRGA